MSTIADYEAEDVLVVSEPEQLRALGDELRARIVALLGERSASTSQLASLLGLPKGTVGHHVKVLERAGLVHVVRTRKVRALTEKFYGRVARLYVFRSVEPVDDTLLRGVAVTSLRTAAAEVGGSPHVEIHGVVRGRLTDADLERFERRLAKLLDDFRRADDPEGRPFRLAAALYAPEARDA